MRRISPKPIRHGARTKKAAVIFAMLVGALISLSATLAGAYDRPTAPVGGVPASAPSVSTHPPLVTPPPVQSKVDTGDTAFVLLSAALVLFMTPGLALFYAGMVRTKNVLGTMMHSFAAIAVVSVQWIIIGYSLSFGPDLGGIIGNLGWIGLNTVGAAPNADYAPTIPHLAFMVYQMMFAVITPALISGAIAERVKFSSFVIFILLWSTLVYDPVAHWVWGTGGWLKKFGVLDFAGGIVVHITSGVSALAAALMMGKRREYPHEPIYPHSLPMTVIGTAILWFGWFGFNGGSALASGGLSVSAFVATHISAVGAMLFWLVIEWVHRGKPTMLGAATGAVAGLATVTPASGFVGPMSSLLIGLTAGGICYLMLTNKRKFGFDDSLDAFSVHGVGGFAGTLMAGLFAQKAINAAGADGLFFGNAKLFGIQLLGASVVAVFSFVVSAAILKAIDMTIGLRVDREAEQMGLDISEHGESSYNP